MAAYPVIEKAALLSFICTHLNQKITFNIDDELKIRGFILQCINRENGKNITVSLFKQYFKYCTQFDEIPQELQTHPTYLYIQRKLVLS